MDIDALFGIDNHERRLGSPVSIQQINERNEIENSSNEWVKIELIYMNKKEFKNL